MSEKKKIPIWQILIVFLAVVVVALFILRTEIKKAFWPYRYSEAKIGQVTDTEKYVYRCPMDGYERDTLGICKICNMELDDTHKIKKVTKSGEEPRITVNLSSDQIRAIGLKTEPVSRRQLTKEIRTVGTLEIDQLQTVTVTARVPGRIDELYVTY